MSNPIPKRWRFVRDAAVPGDRRLLLPRTGPTSLVAIVTGGQVYVGRCDE